MRLWSLGRFWLYGLAFDLLGPQPVGFSGGPVELGPAPGLSHITDAHPGRALTGLSGMIMSPGSVMKRLDHKLAHQPRAGNGFPPVPGSVRRVPLRIQQQLHRRTLIAPRWPGLAQFHEPLLNLGKPLLNRDPSKRAAVLWGCLASASRHSVKISVHNERRQLHRAPAAPQ